METLGSQMAPPQGLKPLHPYVVIYRELLKKIFSRTTRPISTKLAWEMGIQICSNKGAGSFWGPIRGNIRKI